MHCSYLRVCATAYANMITVTNTNDSGPGSLRQAVVDANGGDTITFAVTGTIGSTSAELVIDKILRSAVRDRICWLCRALQRRRYSRIAP